MPVDDLSTIDWLYLWLVMSSSYKPGTLANMLRRGDRITVSSGELIIEPFSSLPVPPEWLDTNQAALLTDVLVMASCDGYIYKSYSTGRYAINGAKRADGIMLIFESLLTGDTVPVFYNVNLNRLRNTPTGKAGSPLPKGDFRVSDRHNFYKFWKSTGLPLPPRLSSFPDRMGNLKGLIFACEIDPHSLKVKNKIIPLLTITTDQLLAILNKPVNSTDNSRTSHGQLTDNSQTIVTDKEINVGQLQQGLEPDQSACLPKCETSKQDNTYTRSNVIPIDTSTKRVQDQSGDEWLDAYGD